ncbi:hypothetical protein JCM19379_13000 [Methyloparacoccus murrellii]
MRMKPTRASVKVQQPPEPGTTNYQRGDSLAWNDDLRGFGMLVTLADVKRYIVRERRHTIGLCSAGASSCWGEVLDGLCPSAGPRPPPAWSSPISPLSPMSNWPKRMPRPSASTGWRSVTWLC